MPGPTALQFEITSRGRADDGSETSATWLAPAGSVFAVGPGQTFRWRSQVGDTVIPSSRFYTVQYSLDGATWVTITNATPVVQIAATSQGFTDQTATTNQLGIPEGYSGFTSGWLMTADAQSNSINDFPGEVTEIEWTLKLVSSVALGQVIHLRTFEVSFGVLAGYASPASFVAIFPVNQAAPVTSPLAAQYESTVPITAQTP